LRQRGTFEGAKELVSLGVDGIKVGIGPGSICTTRVVSGAGVPQITAILECARAVRGTGVPLVADGGVKYSGDVTKAIAAGADTVMIGSLLAGTDESPGETILFQAAPSRRIAAWARWAPCRRARPTAMSRTPVPSWCRGHRRPRGFQGPLADLVYQLVGGLRAGMGYCGVRSLAELQNKARFLRISPAGLRESHVHDVIITKEAPNYRAE